jgi:hypothetical protein
VRQARLTEKILSGFAKGGAGFEHAKRAKADRGIHTRGFCEVGNKVEEMVGSHSHEEGDFFGFVIFEGVGNHVNGGVPCHRGG